MKTESTKAGWTKIARCHYRHETGAEVCKGNQGWEVVSGVQNVGFSYQTMWTAMWYAAGTPAEFVQ